VNASQGDNAEQIAQAQAMLDAVSTAFDECVKREAEAKSSEIAAKAAQAELEAALADLKAQEDAYNNKTEDLKKKSTEGGVVSRNRAKVQLDAHLAEGGCMDLC
jgi:chromosome segregation ATPase